MVDGDARQTPKISVIMPVYNNERYLQEAIDSILAQTFKDFEFIIISEHGTNDESLAIIKKNPDTRIRHIHNETRLGLAKSLDVGVKEARGIYVARMDADDTSTAERLDRQVHYMDSHPEIGVLGTWCEIVDAEGMKIDVFEPPVEHELIAWHMFFSNPIAHPSVMFRQDIYPKIGGYNPLASDSEDYQMWFRAISKTRLSNLPEKLMLLRKHNQNISFQVVYIPTQNQITIKQQAASHLLKMDVPQNKIIILSESKAAITHGEAKDAINLLLNLCDRYVEMHNISESHANQIYLDTLSRIYRICISFFRKAPLSAMALFMRTAMRRHGYVSRQTLFSFARKLLKNKFQSA
jgi:glycosyltransferase involved in cell wall biosynthesis